MRIRFFSVLAVAGLALSSCAVEETPMGAGSINAVMESEDTRTSVTDEGRFTWSAGDQVWLHTTGGGIVGTLSSGAGTSSAQFAYGAYFGDMTGKAVYPYNAGHSVSDDQLSVVLPASYDLGSDLSNTNAAMYGENVGGKIKFNHLAGVMRFVLKNVPAGANRFQLTLDKKINGTFTADLTADYPIIETETTSTASEKTVTLNFDALTKTSDISLYIPLPVGTYTTLGLGLYDDDKEIWTYSNTVTNTIGRKTLKLMPSVSMGGTIGGDIEGEDSGNENEGTEEPVEPQEQLDFDENHCIYYRSNKTGGWDSGMNNYRAERSRITCSAGGQTIEMKFKLEQLGTYDEAYLGSSSNLAKDECDEFKATPSVLSLYYYANETSYDFSWKWSDIGVAQTDLITLRFSGADETITVNGHVLECPDLRYLSWTYIFSSYFRENDEGIWEEYYTLPDGSAMYYVKMYDSEGTMTYHGYAAKAINPETSQLEYCWYSIKDGIATCQFAHDSANQGGYTANF